MRVPRLGEIVWVTDRALIGEVFHAAPEMLGPQEGLDAIYGQGSVLLAKGGHHRWLRSLLLPPLRRADVEPYRPRLSTVVEESVGNWPEGRTFPLLPKMRRITLDVILRCLFDLPPDRLKEWRQPFSAMLALVTSRQMTLRFLSKPGRGAEDWRCFQSARRECQRLIQEQVRCEEGMQKPSRSILASLLAGLPEEASASDSFHLQDQLLTLIIGAQDAPAITLTWAFEYLIRDPLRLTRLRDEASRLGVDGDLPYSEAVVKETLRLRPPISIVMRRALSTFPLGEYTLAPGTLVVPYLSPLSSRGQNQSFEPECFLGGESLRSHGHPFGGGAHSCIGAPFSYLSLKTILSELALRVQLAPARQRLESSRRQAATVVPARSCRVRLVSKGRSRRGPIGNLPAGRALR